MRGKAAENRASSREFRLPVAWAAVVGAAMAAVLLGSKILSDSVQGDINRTVADLKLVADSRSASNSILFLVTQWREDGEVAASGISQVRLDLAAQEEFLRMMVDEARGIGSAQGEGLRTHWAAFRVAVNDLLRAEAPQVVASRSDRARESLIAYQSAATEFEALLHDRLSEKAAFQTAAGAAAIVLVIGILSVPGTIVLFYLRSRHRSAMADLQASESHQLAANERLKAVQARLEDKMEELQAALDESSGQASLFQYASIRFQQLFGGLPVGCLTYDRDGCVQEWNDAMTEITGIRGYEVCLQPIPAVFQREQCGRDILLITRAVIERGQRQSFEWTFELESDIRHVFCNTYPLKSMEGEILGGILAVVDITDSKRVQIALKESEARFRDVTEAAGEYVWETDNVGRLTFITERVRAVLGRSPEALIGHPWSSISGEDRRDEVDLLWAGLTSDGEPFRDIDLQLLRGDKETRWHRMTGTPVRSAQGALVGYRGTGLDITDQKRAEHGLRESERRLDLAVQVAELGLWDWDVRRDVVIRGGNWHRLLGFHPSEVPATHAGFQELVHPDDRDQVADAVRAHLESRSLSLDFMYRLKHKHEGWIWVHDVGQVVERDAEGEPIRAVGLYRDITLAKRAEEEIRAKNAQLEAQRRQLEEANAQLADLATKDGLTGLRNHKAFQEHLSKQFGRSKEHGSPLSLVLLDVDSFKLFNDTFGHPAGDEVLKRVAAILESGARGSDLIARYGGEEFVVVLDRTDLEEAMRIAERFRLAIQNADWELRPITASFGVASLDETTESKQDMVDRADAALYASKRMGRNQVADWNSIRRDQAA